MEFILICPKTSILPSSVWTLLGFRHCWKARRNIGSAAGSIRFLKKRKRPAFFEGKIYHTLILEPDEFANRYVVEPDSVAKMSRKSSAYWAWAQGQKKQIIKADLAEKIANSLLYLGNPGQVLDSEIFKQGHPEVSILFEYRGVACKARIDYLKSIQMWDLKISLCAGSNFSDWCKKYFFKYKTFIQTLFLSGSRESCKGFTEKQVFGTPQLEFWKTGGKSKIFCPVWFSSIKIVRRPK